MHKFVCCYHIFGCSWELCLDGEASVVSENIFEKVCYNYYEYLMPSMLHGNVGSQKVGTFHIYVSVVSTIQWTGVLKMSW